MKGLPYSSQSMSTDSSIVSGGTEGNKLNVYIMRRSQFTFSRYVDGGSQALQATRVDGCDLHLSIDQTRCGVADQLSLIRDWPCLAISRD